MGEMQAGVMGIFPSPPGILISIKYQPNHSINCIVPHLNFDQPHTVVIGLNLHPTSEFYLDQFQPGGNKEMSSILADQ
jgi:hypothetical protein